MREDKTDMMNCAYVIDQDYRILHYNTAIKKLYPDLEIGDICYKKLTGENEPCRVCPLRTPKREGLLYYNKIQKVWVDCTAAPLNLGHDMEDHIVICHTINEMRQDQKQQALRLLAEEGKERNVLTGLYNRETFLRKVDAMLRAIRPSEYCMIALDIENFKLYNSWYGFQKGSDFLHYIGYTMNELCRNVGLAGYMGGDDFAAFLPNRVELIEDLLDRLKYYIDSREESVGFYPAIGICVIDDVDSSVIHLYDKASTARTFLRGNHTTRMIWYEEAMIREMKQDHHLLNDLKRALRQDEFVCYLQPKCNMKNKQIVGMEALCRWAHPEKGLLAPGTFVPNMEVNGLITRLDLCMWEKACQILKSWQESGKKLVPVSVNVSRVDFLELDIVRELNALTAQYGVAKEYLELEVTESAYVEQEIVVKRTIEQLREAGFTVSMDDFGSGYSSLNMLQNAPVDILKLDMRFLQMDADSQKRGTHILEMIVHLAKTLKIRMIAEGVETERHQQLLLQLGCEYAQGYYYYHPMTVAEAETLLATADVGRMELAACEETQGTEESGLDTRKLLAHLSEMSDRYLAQQKWQTIYASVLHEVFDETLELDARNHDTGELIRNVLLLLERTWSLPSNAAEMLRDILKPEKRQEAQPGQLPASLPVRGTRIITEDNRELLIICTFMDNQKGLLCVRDRGEIPAERIMMNHPLLWSYDYHVEQDVMRIVSSDESGKMNTVIRENFLKNMRKRMRENKERSSVFRKELNKALKAPVCGMFEYEVDNSLMKELPGEEIWKRMYYRSIADRKGKIVRLVGIAGNIEKEHRSAEAWKEKANRDLMTGFFNHDAAFYRMEEALETAGGGTLIALDIDNFKRINDTIGHIQGDECIKKLANLMRQIFRGTDLIGRIGGDEFLIFMPGVTQIEIPKKRIRTFLTELKKIRMPRVGTIQCSVGISSSGDAEVSIRELHKQADYALYEAKNAGKGHFVAIEDGKAIHHGIRPDQPDALVNTINLQKEYELIGELYVLLHQTGNRAEGINRALACLGEKMDVSRVYVLEIEDNELYVNNTYEWCAEGISPEIDRLQKLDVHDLGFDINSHFAQDDMWFCPDVSLVQETGMRKLLEVQNIRSLLHWAFRRDGKIVGMIGFDECRENIIWSTQYANTLKNAGTIISEYIMG